MLSSSVTDRTGNQHDFFFGREPGHRPEQHDAGDREGKKVFHDVAMRNKPLKAGLARTGCEAYLSDLMRMFLN